ncbi:exported hypothetical protein [uncultured delta proteobacterium]|uniref:Lipoprotein n=1 Tax=uncultured delta proteobacterium TaxID=34034 RepID=A0A212JUT3_9DELT|nr:exported hypothetical protein [uncultured delta proteobacterium]
MTAFRSLPRFAMTACFVFLVAGLAACAKQPDPQTNLAKAGARANMGDFTVFAVEAEPGTNLVQPTVLYKNRDISQPGDPVREMTPGKIVLNFPQPGCESMKVETFTGGANCCFGYYLLTTCPDGPHAAYIEPQNGGVGDAEQKLRAYPIDDPAFFYYEPQNQTGGTKLSLSRVDSPRITRFLVFDNGVWRADHAGELAAAYKALLDQARKDKTMNKAARAISMAYYSLMAGGKTAAAERLLKQALPREYTHLTPAIMKDIQTSVSSFNPVRSLTVTQ